MTHQPENPGQPDPDLPQVPPPPFAPPGQAAGPFYADAPAEGNAVPAYGAPVPPSNPYGQPDAGTPPVDPYGQQPPYGQPADPFAKPAPYGQQPPVDPYAQQAPYGQQPPYVQDPYAQPYAQPAPYGQQPYGQPTYYAPVSTGPKGLSITSMAIGLASLVLGFGFLILPSIAGIITGHMGLKKESPQGKGFAITGLITSYLALAGWIVFYIFLAILAASASTYHSTY